MSFYLNDFLLSTCEIKETCEMELKFPKEKINKGQNFVHFRVDEDYYEFYRNNVDIQNPAELFYVEKIHFDESHKPSEEILKKENASQLLQPSGSLFRIAVNPKETRAIHYRFTPSFSGNAQGMLTVRTLNENAVETSVEKISVGSENEKTGQFNFQDTKDNTIIEIAYHSSDMGSYIQWDQIVTEDHPLSERPGQEMSIENRPHVFLIVIDAARFDLINKEINGRLVTPKIHEFSQRAYNFQNFYANAPNTRISVASMLSGFLPETHTVINTFNRLPDNVKTLPSYLKDNGYATTAIVGNLVLLVNDLVKDFDSIYTIRKSKRDKFSSTSFMQIPKTKKTLKDLDYEKPNFVYIHFLPPHKPYNPPAPYNKNFVDSTTYDKSSYNVKEMNIESFHLPERSFVDFLYDCYLNNLFYADHLVDVVLKALKDKQVFDESIVIVTSDHGEAFYEHHHLGHNSTNYQEMIKIPFLVKLPHQEEMKVVEGHYSLIDLLPTLASLLNIQKENHWQGDPILFQDRDRNLASRALYSSTFVDQFNLSLIYNKHKYIFYAGRDELYYLEEDPEEANNIAGENRFLTLYLKQKLLRQLGENFRLSEELGIKPVEKEPKKKILLDELKTLGYIR